MRNFKFGVAALFVSLMLSGTGNAFAGMFDALIESVTKGVVEQAVGGAANQAAQPAQAAQPTGVAQPVLQNGCYYGLPQMPSSAAGYVADADRNGCVDYNEMSTYMQVYQSQVANVPQQAAAPSGGAGFLGALAGGVAQQAVSGRGASPLSGMSGPGGAWVGANMALATAGQAAQGQRQPANNSANAALAASAGITPAEAALLGNYAQAKQAGMSNQAAALVASNQSGGGMAQANNAANAPYMANSQPTQIAMNNPQNTTGKDDLWEVVAKIDIPGMALAPQTNRVCAQAGKMRNEDKIPQDKNCSVLESRQTGDKYTFNMACEQNGTKVMGSGEVISGRDSYQGTVRTQTTAGGQAMSVTTNFSGRKVGNCTFGK